MREINQVRCVRRKPMDNKTIDKVIEIIEENEKDTKETIKRFGENNILYSVPALLHKLKSKIEQLRSKP